MLNFLPYALAAYGGYRGYRDSKDQGISGINRLLNTAAGAAIGYNLGTYVPGVKGAGFGLKNQTYRASLHHLRSKMIRYVFDHWRMSPPNHKNRLVEI